MAVIHTERHDTWVNESGSNLKAFINKLSPSKVFVLVDENTRYHCWNKLESILSGDEIIIEIKSGESNKTLDTCAFLWEQLLKNAADRKSLLVNLGGGVIGDMGGFVASTYMRGIPFIQIPTSLLAQVDASIGAKLGVDFKKYKNLIGVFQSPLLVYIKTDFLRTLEKRQMKSGFAEIIKHALIRSPQLWNSIREMEDIPELTVLTNLIIKSVNLKNHIVGLDPLESGIRKILNFGHTIGHAVESAYMTKSEPLLHGEAIAIGMICESFISFKKGALSQDNLDEISFFITKVYSDIRTVKLEKEKILHFINHDKKNIGQQKLFALLQGIGDSVYNIPVDEDLIIASLEYYTAHA